MMKIKSMKILLNIIYKEKTSKKLIEHLNVQIIKDKKNTNIC